jgi:hypothetical protein
VLVARCPAGQRSFIRERRVIQLCLMNLLSIIVRKLSRPLKDTLVAGTIKFDGFVTAIHHGELYSEVPYTMVGGDGTVRTEKGLYLIVDGDYHKWKCLQCPMKPTSLL